MKISLRSCQKIILNFVMALIEDLECIAKIFFGIFSARDNLSLWVIGPSVGQFIAGIRQVLHPSSYYGSDLMKVSGILENLIVQEFPRRKLCPRSWLRVEVRVNAMSTSLSQLLS